MLISLLHPHFTAAEDSSHPSYAGPERSETAARPQPTHSIIYVPFDRFSDTFENGDASIVLPYAEYLKLWDLQASAGDTEQPPVEGVITRAVYRATVENDMARIQAALTVNVVGKPWVSVPLNFGDAAVGSVTSESGKVLLRGHNDGTYSLLFQERGEQQVQLELTARVITSPEGRQIELDVPPAGMTTFEISVPEPEQEIEIRPRLSGQSSEVRPIAVRPDSPDPAPVRRGSPDPADDPTEGLPTTSQTSGPRDVARSGDRPQQAIESSSEETRVRAELGATQHITASWRPKATAQPQMQLLTNVNNRQRFHIAEGLIHTDAWLTYQVLRGELKQVQIVVPPGDRVLDVTASTRVQGWQTEAGDDRQVLTIELLNAVDNEVTVEVHTERKLDGNSAAVGGYEPDGAARGIHALDVVRESGQVVVSHGDDLNVRVTDQSGLVRIRPEEVAREVRESVALAYKYYGPGFTLEVAVSPVEPRVKVAQLVNLIIGEDELEVLANLSYTIERSGVFELRIGLPDDVIVDDVQSDHLQEYRVTDNTLVVALRERTLGNVSLAISAHRPLEADTAELSLPVPEPLGVDRNTGVVRLFADDAVDITTNEDALESARPAPAPPGETRGRARLRAAWQFNHSPVAIPITMTRKPTRLSAAVATDISVEPTRTRVTTLVDFNVEYAGLDRFRVSIPQEAVATLQIEAVPTTPTSPALKQQTAGEAVDGWVPYTLAMQRDVLGRQRFRIIYDLEPSARIPSATVEAEGSAATAANDAAAPQDDTTDEAGSANESTVTAAPAQESSSSDEDADAADRNRMLTTIRIIRPLGIEADAAAAVTPLSRVTGEVRLEKDQTLTIAADAAGADIEPIDVRELATLPQSGTFAFRYRKHPPAETIAVEVTQARYGVQEVIATVVSRALVEVVLGEDLTATYRCRYRLKTAERQRLPVDLPKGLEVLSVLVDGEDVRLEPDPAAAADELWDSYFVKVARSGASDEPFSLTFQFLWSVNPQPFERGLQGRIQLPLPRIGEPASAAVQQTRVVVWVPENYALIGDPDGFTLLGRTSFRDALRGRPMPRSQADDDEWIGGETKFLAEFPTQERFPYRYSNLGGRLERDPTIRLLWWNTVWYTIVVSGTIAVVALLLLRTSWENKLGILLLLAFGGMLLGLMGEHVLAQAFAAARFGLLFLLGLWIIEALFGRRPQTAPIAPKPRRPSARTGTIPAYAAVVPPPGVFEQYLSEDRPGHDNW